ncbi:MAG: F0F1 ATP synthase subunit B' [Rhodospirillales bacterium]|nr:F0F1 ATP synthase subunit B' [Rhodospirillales bacterium]
MRSSKGQWALALAVALIVIAEPAFAQGLPQLDSRTFTPQVVWLVIAFVALYLAMSKIALPRIGEVLAERQAKIDSLLKRAEGLKAEAEAVLMAYDKAIAKARTEAQDVVRKTSDSAAKTAADRHTELGTRLGDEIKAAEARVNDTKNKALATIAPAATDIALAVIERLAGEKIDAQALAPAIDATLKERRA